MQKVTIVIPNYNGKKYLEKCFNALRNQSYRDFRTILVDNGSSDGSVEWTIANYPEVDYVALQTNTGFCGAVNRGIESADTPFVILLNNDTEVDREFVREMLEGISRHKRAFSCQAKMIQFHDRSKTDDAGNYYCALGWAFARGKNHSPELYNKEEQIFSSCGGAAIYRKAYLEETGLFDEEHFAYLEDMDICYRALLRGYENWYLPKAIVYHVGSGTTGSRYNQFKVRYSSRNNIYMIYKNMPLFQILINLPFLFAGFGIKLVFFTVKGFGREYAAGIKNGFQLCRKPLHRDFRPGLIGRYAKIQLQLWKNMVRRFTNK